MERSLSLVCLVALLAVLFLPTTSAAAIYMQYEGIRGTVTSAGHENWIELNSSSIQISRPDRDPRTSLIVRPILISKLMDESSVPLYAEAFRGSAARTVRIDFTSMGADFITTYFEIVLSDVVISSTEVSTGGDRPQDAFALNYGRIEMKYTPYDERGQAGSPIMYCWDVATNGPC